MRGATTGWRTNAFSFLAAIATYVATLGILLHRGGVVAGRATRRPLIPSRLGT